MSNSEQSRNTPLIKAREWLWHGYVFLPQPWLTAHGYVTSIKNQNVIAYFHVIMTYST